MSYTTSSEQPVSFLNQKELIHGVLHSPEALYNDTGVIFCHGWSGTRLGPHRMFVKTARRLAEDGVPCFRFDFRGRGSSGGDREEASIQSMIADTLRAKDEFSTHVNISRVIIIGICSGAKVAIGAAMASDDVPGLALWSPEALGKLRETETERKKKQDVLRTYLKKMTDPSTWKRLIRGKIDLGGVKRAFTHQETPDTSERAQENDILENLQNYTGKLLFIYGGNDPDTALAGKNYRAFCERHNLQYDFDCIEQANHSFYSLEWEKTVIDETARWISKIR